MSMDYNGSRLFAMTLAHRAICDVKKDGFRQLRNYVDMCAVLSNGPMQSAFFERAQGILEKTDSLYYNLIQRLVNEVEEDRICTIGVNMGLGGLVYGAGKLKNTAEQTKKPFSWITVALSGDQTLPDAVTEAEAAGQYVWILQSVPGQEASAITLAKNHPHSVFYSMRRPEEADAVYAAAAGSCKNLIPVLILDSPEITESAHAAAELLQREKLLFGFVVQLNDQTEPDALLPQWLDVLALQGLFCVYARRADMSKAKSEHLRKGIYHSRTSSGAPLLLLDWESDVDFLNRHISPYAVTGYHLPDGVKTLLNG